jgi:hypothetical protein
MVGVFMVMVQISTLYTAFLPDSWFLKISWVFKFTEFLKHFLIALKHLLVYGIKKIAKLNFIVCI